MSESKVTIDNANDEPCKANTGVRPHTQRCKGKESLVASRDSCWWIKLVSLLLLFGTSFQQLHVLIDEERSTGTTSTCTPSNSSSCSSSNGETVFPCFVEARRNREKKWWSTTISILLSLTTSISSSSAIRLSPVTMVEAFTSSNHPSFRIRPSTTRIIPTSQITPKSDLISLHCHSFHSQVRIRKNGAAGASASGEGGSAGAAGGALRIVNPNNGGLFQKRSTTIPPTLLHECNRPRLRQFHNSHSNTRHLTTTPYRSKHFTLTTLYYSVRPNITTRGFVDESSNTPNTSTSNSSRDSSSDFMNEPVKPLLSLSYDDNALEKLNPRDHTSIRDDENINDNNDEQEHKEQNNNLLTTYENDTHNIPSQTQKESQNHQRHNHIKRKFHRKTNSAPSWLEHATNDILDLSRIPLGQLTSDDIESITNLMANWAKNNKHNNNKNNDSQQQQSQASAIQVEKLLKRVVDDHNHGNSSVKVTTRMYAMAIDAWAKTGGKKAAERAHMIHSNMVELYKATCDDDIRPSTISYNAVLNAWSKSGCEEACFRAESILEEMLDGHGQLDQLESGQSTSSSSTPLSLPYSSLPSSIQRESVNDHVTCPEAIRGPFTYADDFQPFLDNDKVVKADVVSFTSVIGM